MGPAKDNYGVRENKNFIRDKGILINNRIYIYIYTSSFILLVFFPGWRIVTGNQFLSIVIEGELIYQSVYVRHQEINYE